jgi:hypothetical protein
VSIVDTVVDLDRNNLLGPKLDPVQFKKLFYSVVTFVVTVVTYGTVHDPLKIFKSHAAALKPVINPILQFILSFFAGPGTVIWGNTVLGV